MGWFKDPLSEMPEDIRYMPLPKNSEVLFDWHLWDGPSFRRVSRVRISNFEVEDLYESWSEEFGYQTMRLPPPSC